MHPFLMSLAALACFGACVVPYVLLYPIFVVGSMTATLSAYLLVNWWAPLLADDSGNLPRCLKWYQTFDASLDAGWRDGYFMKPDDPSPYGWRLFWYRVKWMYRNPAYGFDMFAFGALWDKDKWRLRIYSETDTSTVFLATGPWVSFNFYYWGKWGQYKLGWKAWNHWDGKSFSAPSWEGFARVPLCFTINPFKKYVKGG